MTAIPLGRLVETYRGLVLHISLPDTPYFALCGVRNTSRSKHDDVVDRDLVCIRCRRAFEREEAS